MRRLFLFVFASLLAGVSGAEIKVPIIPLGWEIAFEAPQLKLSSFDYPESSIQFRANAGMFNVSVFVEPPPDGAQDHSHTACREFYWSQAKRNPAIVVDSIKMTTTHNCEVVTYRAKGEYKGTPFVQDNVNCFFVHAGRWMDLHASIIQPAAEDTKLLSEFASHLTYGPWKASEGKMERFPLGELGTLSLTPPKGWLTGNVLKDDTGKGPTQFTVSFSSATDVNSKCLLTLFAAPNGPKSPDDLHKAVEASTAPAAKASVEGKAVIRDLKLKQGFGAVAPFTDASLVGKPVEPGNTKALASGMIALKPGVLAVVSMFMDDARGADARLMVSALETIGVD